MDSNGKQKQYTSLAIDPEFDLDLSGVGPAKSTMSSTIHPFQKRHNKLQQYSQSAVHLILNVRSAKRTMAFILLNACVIWVLSSWCESTNSLALQAFLYILIFDLMCLITNFLSMWGVEITKSSSDDVMRLSNPERLEVVFIFTSLCLAMFGSIFIFKESLIRFLLQPEINTGRLLPGVGVGLSFHVLMAFSVKNQALHHISEASSSSSIQEHIDDMLQNTLSSLSSFSKLCSSRVDPFHTLCMMAAFCIAMTYIFIQIDLYYFADTIAAVLITSSTLITMLPVATCTARILLNTLPQFTIGQLDKLLSEAQTIDGVLEVRNERFFTVALHKPTQKRENSLPFNSTTTSSKFGLVLSGAVEVRVRRDADAQMVLAHVANKLAPLVRFLTVQIVKDEEWNTSPMPPKPGIKAFSHHHQNKVNKTPSQTHLIKGFNKPAAAVAPYRQKLPETVAEKKNPAAGETPAPKPTSLADDFNFAPKISSSSAAILKPKTTTSAGDNIARMYRAAGFKQPPSKAGVHGSLTQKLGSTRTYNSKSK